MHVWITYPISTVHGSREANIVSFTLATIHLPLLWGGVQFPQISTPAAILVLRLPKEKNSDRIQY